MIDASLLEPAFATRVKKTLNRCAEKGFSLVPYEGLRSPWRQAKLYRSSRTKREIERAVWHLETVRAPFLARVLEEVGPQGMGPWKTSALPGESWHNWGLAVDSYLERADGRADWNAGSEGYRVYAKAAKDMGLEAGFYWQRKDAVHVQHFKGSVLDHHEWHVIDELMREKYGNSNEIEGN